MANASLQQTLAPLSIYLQNDTVHELMINKPDELWVDNGKSMTRENISFSYRIMQRFANLIAAETGQIISDSSPLLSATLPGGHRVQLVMSPASQYQDSHYHWQDTLTVSIRKKSNLLFDLDQFAIQGGFSHVAQPDSDDLSTLKQLYHNKYYQDFLIHAVKAKCNILISGGTYSGKTSLLNMLLQYINKQERVITIEDAPELVIANDNRVRLFYSRGLQSKSQINAFDLLNASLRLRPDRIIMGELRDDDAICWLQAINTGHTGTISTIHSDTPLLAIQKLIDMVRMKYTMQSEENIRSYIRNVLDVVVQIKRDPLNGKRYISDILFLKE